MVVGNLICGERFRVNTYEINDKTNTKKFSSTVQNNETKYYDKHHFNIVGNIFNKQKKQDKCYYLNSLFVIQFTCVFSFVLFIIGDNVVQVETAAVFLNADFHSHPRFQPLCHKQQEYFLESNGKESSLILEFKANPVIENIKSCTRILSAPKDYGFIVRLILPKLRRGDHHVSILNSSRTFEENSDGKYFEQINDTSPKPVLNRKCPLSIFSSSDPHTPQWRLDPCQLEDTAPEMEDPVRLFHGRLRILWDHNNESLDSKLMVTVLGKGQQCHHESKHNCLKIGDEPILCISKELECDGIRHCPMSNEYDSDEDYRLCFKHRSLGKPMPDTLESEIFEHFAMEVFRSLFGFDSNRASNTNDLLPTTPLPPHLHSTTWSTDVDLNELELLFINSDNVTDSGILFNKRNNSRSGLHSDLSKYGPWGYLMLGMLLCGGALLICGLWASASQSAVNNERESAIQQGGHTEGNLDNSFIVLPPNYEELEPPPAYSILFPNFKALDESSETTGSVPTSSLNTEPSSSQPLANIAEVPDETVGCNTYSES